MDTISSSLNSFKIPTSFHSTSTPREIYQFKNPKSHNHHLPLNPHFSYSTTKTSNSIPAKPTTLITHPFNSSSPSRSPKQSPPRTETVHRKATSGYATALLDMAQSNNSLEAVERDVKRLLKWLRDEELFAVLSDPCVGENEKGKVMKEVVVKGRFHRYLVKLVNLLVKKNKVKMMSEVLSEFERIYDELSGTRLVFLQCEMKRMELKQKEDFLFRIAEKARKLSGAVKVKVKHAISVA